MQFYYLEDRGGSISSTDEQYKILCKIISKETVYKLFDLNSMKKNIYEEIEYWVLFRYDHFKFTFITKICSSL